VPDSIRQQIPKTDRKIAQVVLKLASRCNLNCSYCYVYNDEDTGFGSRPKMISDDIFDMTLSRIKDYCQLNAISDFALCFRGGEPTLVGLRRFRELVIRARRTLRQCLGGVSLQTNGTLINESWAKALKELGVGVSVSLDGPADVHDARRIYHRGGGSHSATVRGSRYCKTAKLAHRSCVW
jgi:uncharacterized protein